MQRRSSIYKKLVFTIVLMLFGLVSSAATTPVPYRETLTAPSELAKNLPHAKLPETEVLSPFLDPTEMAFKKAVGGIIEAELPDSDNLVRLEPLTPHHSSSPLINVPKPSLSLPALANPLANVRTGLAQPHNLTAFTKQDEAAEESLDFDIFKKNTTSSEATTTSFIAETEVDNVENAPAVIESPPGPMNELLVRQATVSGTVESGPTGQEGPYKIVLPIILKNSDGSSNPLSPNTQGIVTPETGGVLAFADNTVFVDFPPGAVSEQIVVSFKNLSPVVRTTSSSSINHFTLEAKTISSDKLVTQFHRPITITVKFAPDITSSRLSFYYRQDYTAAWAPLSTQIDATNNIAYAVTSHFTDFALMDTADDATYVPIEEHPGSHSFNFNGVPFEYQAVDRWVQQDPGGPFPSSEIINLSGHVYTGTAIHMITYGSWVPDMPTGSTLGYATVHYEDGDSDSFPLVIGQNTAEWSYDRPELQDCLAHSKIPQWEAITWETTRDSSSPYLAHNYYTAAAIQPKPLVSLELALNPDAASFEIDTGVPCVTLGKHSVGINGLTVQTSGEFSIDLIPPTIHETLRWLSDGRANIRALVTDNVEVADVTLVFNGQNFIMNPIGDDWYETTVAVPLNEKSDWQVVATDTSGNMAVFAPNQQIEIRGYPSQNLGQHNSACSNSCNNGYRGNEADPVFTDNGNFTYHTTDLVVAGIGGTDIVIERNYNSLPNEEQGIIRYTMDGDTLQEDPFYVHPEPFSLGWTFSLGPSLLVMDNDLLRGVQVRYTDGHTANFADNGDSTFTPVETRIYDKLTTEGDGYLLKRKELIDYRFDADGRLTSIADRNGNTITLSYSGDQLTSVTNAAGRTITFGYNGEGLITDISAPEGVHLQYQYENGQLIAFTDGEGNTTRYGYNAEGRLEAIITPKGHPSLRLSYNDEVGRVTEQTIGAAEHYTFAYDNDNRITTITDVYDNQTTHFYDEQYRLVQSRNALGFSEHYGYDANDHRIYFKDRAGREWHYTFDKRGNRLSEDGPLGWHREFEYNTLNLVTLITEQIDSGTTRDTKFVYDGKGNLTDIINALTNTSTIIYDGRGLPTNIFDFNGNETVNTYDPVTGDLLQTRNAEVDEVDFTYDGLGRLKTMTNGRGFVYTYTYDDNDNLTAVDGPLGYHLGYEYDPNNNLKKEFDPNSGEVEHFYDTSENLIRVKNQLDFPTSYGYDDMNNLTRLVDAEGREWIFGHNEIYDHTATHGPEDTHTFFTYDAVSNPADVIRCNSPLSGNDCPVKQITHYDYNDLDQLIAVANPEGHRVQFEYNLVGDLLILTDARGNQTRFTYDILSRLILMVDTMDGEWRYEYDKMENLLRHIDANDHPNNTYTYDKVYRLRTSTDAEGKITSYTYDENGNVITITDGNNHTTTLTYNELDRLDSLTNAETETTEYRYDLAGNQTHLIEADGVVTLYGYDPVFRLVSVTLNSQSGQPETADTNVDTHYTYDKVGNLRVILDAEERETLFYYDGLNRLIQEVDALQNTWDYEYDRLSNRIARTDANRNRTEYEYYPDNQLQRIAYHDGDSVEYTYDQNNNRRTMVDHLGVTTWVYDKLNRVTDVTDPFGRHLGYGYDAVSNRTRLTYPDQRTVSYTYYDNNWLKTVVDPESNVTAYERDGVGLVRHTTNPNSTISEATYDKANRLLTLTNLQVGGASKTNSAFTYTYDDVGQRTQMVAEYAWRNPGIVTSDYTYDPLRRLVRDEDSEGRWTDYTFDRVGNRLTLRTNDDSLSPRPFDEKSLDYSYNAINQVLTIVGDTHPGQPGTKREDNIGQAIHAFRHEVAAQRGKHISESAADDLLAMADALIVDLENKPAPKENEVMAAIEAIRNRVVAYRASNDIDNDGIENSLLVKLNKGDQANNGVSGDLQTTTFSYDANGNRINKEFPGPQGPKIQGMDYSYDPENRLVIAQDYQMNQQGKHTDRAVTTLDYDGDGRRLVKEYDPKTGSGGEKRVEYVFDGLDPVAEYNIWNPQYNNFYRGDLGRITTMHHFPGGSQGQMYWYHYDGLGSVSGLTKHNGNSHHNYRYEPYGQIEMPPGNFTDPHNHYTFTGQELDENMQVYEFFARAYDYNTGTWLQQDIYRGRLGEPKSLHRYQYVENNPINFIDLTGFYGNDVHFYMTYYIGREAGLEHHEAYRIAWATEYTDRHSETEPVNLLDVDQRKKYHFRGEWRVEEKRARRGKTRTTRVYRIIQGGDIAKEPLNLGIANNDQMLMGIGLHAYQDSWAHGNCKTCDTWHVLHKYDDTSKYPNAANEMAEQTYEALKRYAKNQNRCSQSTPFSSIEGKLDEIFKTEGWGSTDVDKRAKLFKELIETKFGVSVAPPTKEYNNHEWNDEFIDAARKVSLPDESGFSGGSAGAW